MRRTSVLIAGGGVSGLTVAYDLARLGIDGLVVEKDTRLGGLISTCSRDGFIMDAGPDAFLTQKPQATVLCTELGLGGAMIATDPDHAKVYVLFRGTLHPLPDGMRLTVPTRWSPLLSSRLFSWGGKMRMLAEPFQPRRSRERLGEESIASFVARRFGREALERVGEPLLAGIHCGDARRLSMDVLFPGLVLMEERHGSVTRGMIAEKAGSTAFASLAGGMQDLIRALRAKLPEDGVVLDRAVTDVGVERDGFVATLASGETVGAKAVVLALPLYQTRTLTRRGFPEVATTLARIPTVSSAVVFHAFARTEVVHPLDGYGFVVPEGESNRLLAATFVSTKFPGRAPPGSVLIRTFVGGRRDPDAVTLSDDELAALCLRELQRAIGPVGEPMFSRVIRWVERTPQVELGHREILADLERALSRTPGLHVLANGLRSVGIPDGIGEARKTAQAVAAYVEGH